MSNNNAHIDADQASEETAMPPVTVLDVIGQWVSKINGVVLVLIAVLMVASVTWQVVSRYFLNMPSTLTDELARFLFMWVGLLGAVQATAYKQHLAIDLLALKVSGMQKIMLNIFIESCILFFSVSVMVIGGWNLTQRTFASQQITPSLQIPMGYVYIVVPIAGVLIAFFAVTEIYRTLKYSRATQE